MKRKIDKLSGRCFTNTLPKSIYENSSELEYASFISDRIWYETLYIDILYQRNRSFIEL